MHFIIKYSFGGENTVFGITEYSFWFPEVGRSASLIPEIKFPVFYEHFSEKRAN